MRLRGRLRVLPARAQKLLALLREPSYRRALWHGTAAAVEHQRVPFRANFQTVLDVGAHRGQFALVAARLFPHAALYCFEPLEKPRAALGKALAGHAQLSLIDRAVAASAGEAELVVANADDSSSLLRPALRQTEEFPGTDEAGRIVVRTAPLDELVDPERLAQPVLLKIDVQGAELEVLRGATEVLRRADSVLVECSFVELYEGQALAGEAAALLHRRGLRLAAVCSPHLDRGGCVIQADLLFERVK